MPAVALYSKPNCVQCTQTMRFFDKYGIEYTEVDITKDQGAYDYVTKELGYQQAPVVVTSDGDHWSGFNPYELNKLKDL